MNTSLFLIKCSVTPKQTKGVQQMPSGFLGSWCKVHLILVDNYYVLCPKLIWATMLAKRISFLSLESIQSVERVMKDNYKTEERFNAKLGENVKFTGQENQQIPCIWSMKQNYTKSFYVQIVLKHDK